MSDGPLHGITVVEFGNLIAAPYAGMLLADMGARVIKVEPPGGDLGRHFGPFQSAESAFFMSVNRGKESLAIDPKDEVARRALETLIKRADVVLHNLRFGAMERLGLGEKAVRDLNATIIYTVISAFGATGPYSERPGIDVIFQGESGMISLTGDPEDGPRKTATTIGDYVAGTNAALATAAALAETPRTGRRVDVSLRDGLMAVQSGWNALNFVNERQPERTGTASPFLAPNQVFQAADRPFTLAIVSDRHFAQMTSVMGQEELLDKYPSNDVRMEQQSDLVAALSRTFITRDADHWVDLFGSVGIPAGHVLTLDEAFDDPQARHHEMLVEFEHPVAGLVQTTGSPVRLDDVPARSARIPPTLGQNTKELLIEMGVDTDTVTQMIEEGRAVTS